MTFVGTAREIEVEGKGGGSIQVVPPLEDWKQVTLPITSTSAGREVSVYL
jgi:hypothetical protein